MSLRTLRLLALATASLTACATDPTPTSTPQPNDPAEPTLPTRTPTVRPDPQPNPTDCSIPPPLDATWTTSTGLTQQVTRRVAATASSLFLFENTRLSRSTDQAQTWQQLEAPVDYVRAVAATSTDLFISGYANGVGNQVFRSTDDGATWQLAAGLDNVIVDTLRADSGIVTAGTHIWSPEAQTFQALPLPEDLFLDRLATDGTAYLGATYGGVFHSADGLEWTHVETLPDVSYPRLFLAGTQAWAIDSQGVLSRSSDGGLTFEQLQLGYAGGKALDVLLTDNALVIATTTGFLRSLDGGATFELTKDAQNPEVDAFFDNAQFLAGHADQLIAGGAAVEVSNDAAASWLDTPRILDATPLALGNSDRYLVASTADMGLHFSEGNDAWMPVDAANHVMKAMASTGDTTFMLLVQAFGSTAYFPDGDVVVSYDGGFTYDVAVRPNNNYMTTFDTLELAGGVLFLGSSSTVTSGGKAPGLAGGTGLWRSFDAGASWDAVNDGFPVVGADYNGDLFEAVLAVRGIGGEGASTQLLVSIANGGVLYSADAGDHFEATDLPPSDLGAPLAIDRLASSDRFAFAGSTVDAGTLLRFDATSKAWAPIDAGLPEAFTIHALSSHAGLLFAGLDAGDASGLYVSADEGDSWQKTDLVGVPVSLLVRGSTLFAGVRHGGLQSVELAPCQ